MRECLGKALWLCFCLSIAGCAEDDRMTPLSADSGDTADELIPIHISLQVTTTIILPLLTTLRPVATLP